MERPAAHQPAPPAGPRAWIACSTPTASRFATIDEPPTLTNGSGMPVTGAMPDRHADVDEDLEQEREDDPAGGDRRERRRAATATTRSPRQTTSR